MLEVVMDSNLCKSKLTRYYSPGKKASVSRRKAQKIGDMAYLQVGDWGRPDHACLERIRVDHIVRRRGGGTNLQAALFQRHCDDSGELESQEDCRKGREVAQDKGKHV